MITRRRFLGTAAAGAFLACPGLVLARARSERRFVFVIQRGAADGLDIVIPHADPGYARLRGSQALDASAGTRLDGTFALHPALAETGRLYAAGEVLAVHAVASPYRDRSHFDGQNVLETGGTAPYQLKDGWLNRLLAMLPAGTPDAVALAPTVPMALRGPGPVTSYAPSRLPQAPDDLLARVTQLYEQDAQLHPLWTAAMSSRELAGRAEARQDAAALGRLAATFLARDDGPRIAMLDTGGWDTHTAQGTRLATQLRGLDAAIAALRDGLGGKWNETVVLVATEFGRTAAANGTGGTDHGTGAAAIVAGGAVKGGRVLADWPGLAQRDLYEGRDLKPTLGLDALVTALMSEGFGLDPREATRALFPGLRGGLPAGLLRA